METPHPDPRTVFVVHGRNLNARDDLFNFLRAIDLNPLEWSQAVHLTGQGSPYVGQVLDAAFGAAQAVVVLLTPDDIAYIRNEYSDEFDPEREPAGQARPNVLFEAGMAFGRNPNRTILVELGALRPFSDVVGRHAVRMNGSAPKRQELINRLETAGCAVNRLGTSWLSAGQFEVPPDPGGGQRLGRRVPAPSGSRIGLTASYQRNGGGHGRLTIRNFGKEEVFDLNVEFPEDVSHSIVDLPLARLPAGESASFPVMAFLGSGSGKFFITIVAKDSQGQEIRVEKFIDMF